MPTVILSTFGSCSECGDTAKVAVLAGGTICASCCDRAAESIEALGVSEWSVMPPADKMLLDPKPKRPAKRRARR